MIEIFPAIDLHNGQAVRLKQGDYNQVEVFFKNPVEVLDFFNKNNSKNLHIVDLDGAKDGMLNGTNLEIYKKLSKIVKSDIIASGGITFLDEIKELNENGVYGAIVRKAIYSGNLDLKEVLEVSK
ncbi:HisA/HisF-related TIM barrel protein [Leptotrichia hongkongensis]|uniref:HisA/HisF-related TIM barrel protein n=1 Tax=Leptotrichia hongkongensis TaxID=554406 RepID=UPI0035A8B981